MQVSLGNHENCLQGPLKCQSPSHLHRAAKYIPTLTHFLLCTLNHPWMIGNTQYDLNSMLLAFYIFFSSFFFLS